MALDLIGGEGCCIICSKRIVQDISNPFCIDCWSDLEIVKKTAFVSAKYCHICGVIDMNINNHFPRCKYCEGFDRDSNVEDDFYKEIKAKFCEIAFSNNYLKVLWTIDELSECQMLKPQGILIKDCLVKDIIYKTGLNNELNVDYVLNNEVVSNKRILNTLMRWEKGLPVDPPSLYLENSGKLTFKDGRHRVLAALYLNVTSIPVNILNFHRKPIEE